MRIVLIIHVLLLLVGCAQNDETRHASATQQSQINTPISFPSDATCEALQTNHDAEFFILMKKNIFYLFQGGEVFLWDTVNMVKLADETIDLKGFCKIGVVAGSVESVEIPEKEPVAPQCGGAFQPPCPIYRPPTGCPPWICQVGRSND